MNTQAIHTALGTLTAECECMEADISVIYRLYERTVPCDSGSVTVYSVELETRTGTSAETAAAFDISRNSAEARRIFRLLSDGTVTSCTLYEVLDNIL